MGAACCVAAKDRTITHRSNNDVQRNARCSPSWSIRWDNRGRVAGEDTSMDCLSDGISRNDRLETKSGTTVVETSYPSEEGSPLDGTLTEKKSLIFERNAGISRLPSSDISNCRSAPTQVQESTESPSVADPSPMKMSPSVHSVSSFSPSPLPSQSPLLHASSTPSQWPRPSPTHQLSWQVSDSRIPGLNSPNISISEEPSFLSNESTKPSTDGSTDGWSMPAFPEFMETSHTEKWSFNSDSSGLSRQKITSQLSSSPHNDIQTCGVCSKVVIERSSWVASELAVVAVLTCGHVYHADCLENMTAEINKYDPACPACTFGEKQALKKSERASRAVVDLKDRNTRSKKRVVNSDLDGDSSVVFDGQKSSGIEGNGLKMISSFGMKSSSGEPFLRKHFSFGSKGSRYFSESHSARKKGLFWTKSSK